MASGKAGNSLSTLNQVCQHIAIIFFVLKSEDRNEKGDFIIIICLIINRSMCGYEVGRLANACGVPCLEEPITVMLVLEV